MKATIGRIVLYRTDGRNGLSYDLPAIITCTPETHPGDYPDGEKNPLPVPDEGCVHLTIFSPGGYGSFVPKNTEKRIKKIGQLRSHDSSEFVGASEFVPGSGSYVEWNVPFYNPDDSGQPIARSWRWPVMV